MASSAMQSSGFVCRSCSRHMRPRLSTSTAARSFSTTFSTPMPSDKSPYSPYYIDIPFPPQRYAVWQPRAKGKRPVPREIFKTKDGSDGKKITAEYLALVSKEPTNQSNPGEDAPATEKAYIQWKAKMSDLRRKNIREGLVELHAQKQERERQIEARSAAKQQRRAKLLAQDEPDDVKLTTPTILSVLRSKAPLTDPDREERLAVKRANYESREAAKAAQRQEELHELYIRSHSFIFTERQLDRTINQVFEIHPTTDFVKSIPPSTEEFVSYTNRGKTDFSLKDEKIIEEFMSALTGGSKRDAETTTTREEREKAMTRDVLKGQFPESNYGYKISAENSEDVKSFNSDFMDFINEGRNQKKPDSDN